MVSSRCRDIERVSKMSKKTRGAIPTATFGNKISNFKTFASTNSITIFSGKSWSYGSKAALLYSVEKKNFENDGIRKKCNE